MTARKLIPILFQPELQKQNLAGQKTETRRTKGLGDFIEDPGHWQLNNRELQLLPGYSAGAIIKKIPSPYGQVGDIIWGRENIILPPDNYSIMDLKTGADTWPEIDYPAGLSDIEIEQYLDWGWVQKPSIHMPLSACRYFAEIVDLRIERLHDITEEGAFKEGVKYHITDGGDNGVRHFYDYMINKYCLSSAVLSYNSLWISINKPGSWSSNPWVWVVKYKKIEISDLDQYVPEIMNFYWDKPESQALHIFNSLKKSIQLNAG